jgi:hydrogenase maturation protease
MRRSRKGPRILIAGLGNLLLTDDGVGVHAVKELQTDSAPDLCVVEVGTAVLDALHLFEWADKILAIDAMQAGGAPGTIYSFGLDDVADASPVSLHEIGLVSAFRFIPEKARPEIRILGVEPEVIDYGLDLSPAVAAALPKLVQTARETVAEWRRNSIGHAASAAADVHT